MNTYTPDRWVIVKITTPDNPPVDKILADWGGGYLHGSYWKLSSGIVDFVDEGDQYTSKQDSGSTYVLRKTSEGLSARAVGVLESFVDKVRSIGGTIEVIDAMKYKE